MTKVLYSAKNTSGWYLEHLLDAIIGDLEVKSNSALHLPLGVADNYHVATQEVIRLLREASETQKAAADYASKHSNLKPYLLEGVEVLACPLSYNDYYQSRIRTLVKFGDAYSEDGYYIVTGHGTATHTEWWLPTDLFLEYTQPV